MSSFCKDCSISYFGKDFGDFAYDDMKENEVAIALCEGCDGYIRVNKDGKRIDDWKQDIVIAIYNEIEPIPEEDLMTEEDKIALKGLKLNE